MLAHYTQAVQDQAGELRFPHTRRNQARKVGICAFEENRVGPLRGHPCILSFLCQTKRAYILRWRQYAGGAVVSASLREVILGCLPLCTGGTGSGG